MTALLNLDALQEAEVRNDPFVFTVVPAFVRPETRPALQRDFPRIEQPGSFPVDALRYGPSFATLLDELRGEPFTRILSDKLSMDLSSHPLLVTVRGQCRSRDGKVHTDSSWKLATVLIYLNDPWPGGGGRLRLLRSEDLDDTVTEVSPEFGNLLAFRRSDRSFHGHRPFQGERRLVQVNWVTSQEKIDRERRRHRRTAWIKRFFPFAGRYGY